MPAETFRRTSVLDIQNILFVIMRWLLAGCCWLAFINISAALDPAMVITQKPRFYGVKSGHNVGIYCLSSEKSPPILAQWYRAVKYDVDDQLREKLEEREKFTFHNSHLNQNTFLLIHDVQVNDSGVYFCKINNTWGPGTALQVARPIDLPLAVYRSKMKDALIILQGLLLAVCIAAFVLRRRQMKDEKDIIYEEPETDHIYEGLAIETCEGGLYEELEVYSEPEGAEAPWE